MKSKFTDYPNSFFCEGMYTSYGSQTVWHIHDKYELMLVLEGTVTVYNGNYSTEVKAPCILLHKPFTIHFIYASPEILYKRAKIYFTDGYLSGYDKTQAELASVSTDNLRILPLNEEHAGRLEKLFTLIEDKSIGHMYPFLLGAIITDLASLPDAILPKARTNRSLYICDIIRHISENYASEIDITELAKSYFVSPTKLKRDFKSYTQTTIGKFTTSVRLKNAESMLLSGSSVGDTAVGCGFSTDSHFIRTFKTHYGITPFKFARDRRGK